MAASAAIIVLGFFLGVRHALDPDHVIAVTTLVSRLRSSAKAALIGVLWGLGHTFTIFGVGTAIILFKVAIPSRVGLSMELAVGMMLILLGILNLTGVLRWLKEKFTPSREVPRAFHERGDYVRAQTQCIGQTTDCTPESGTRKVWLGRTFQEFGLYTVLRPLAVGIVHGLAGSAAVSLLVMTTIREPWWAIAYLLLFGVGTIVGMLLITVLISIPFIRPARRFLGWDQKMVVASGLLSLGFGLFLSYQIGFVDGLFTSHPQWIPR